MNWIKQTDKRGFTIVELIIVIVVVGILAAIVIASYSGTRNRAEKSSYDSHAQQVKLKLGEYFTDNNRYPGTKADVVSYLNSINSSSLATELGKVEYTYAATPAAPTQCTTSGAVLCTSYTITVAKSNWGGGSSDTDVVVNP